MSWIRNRWVFPKWWSDFGISATSPENVLEFPRPWLFTRGFNCFFVHVFIFLGGVTGQALYALHPGKMPGANWSHDALPSLPAKLQARVDGISWEFPTMGDPKVIQVETSPLRDPRHMLYAVYLYIYIILKYPNFQQHRCYKTDRFSSIWYDG